MRGIYDAITETLSIVLKADARMAQSVGNKPRGILHYDDDSALVSLEVLDASGRVRDPRHVEFETTE